MRINLIPHTAEAHTDGFRIASLARSLSPPLSPSLFPPLSFSLSSPLLLSFSSVQANREAIQRRVPGPKPLMSQRAVKNTTLLLQTTHASSNLKSLHSHKNTHT